MNQLHAELMQSMEPSSPMVTSAKSLHNLLDRPDIAAEREHQAAEQKHKGLVRSFPARSADGGGASKTRAEGSAGDGSRQQQNGRALGDSMPGGAAVSDASGSMSRQGSGLVARGATVGPVPEAVPRVLSGTASTSSGLGGDVGGGTGDGGGVDEAGRKDATEAGGKTPANGDGSAGSGAVEGVLVED